MSRFCDFVCSKEKAQLHLEITYGLMAWDNGSWRLKMTESNALGSYVEVVVAGAISNCQVQSSSVSVYF